MNGRTHRVAHVVSDADVALFGSLERIEAEFAVLREDLRLPSDEVRPAADRSA
jgi:hypothetical protein